MFSWDVIFRILIVELIEYDSHFPYPVIVVDVTGSGGLSAAMSDAPLLQNVELEALERKKPASMLVMSGGEGYIDFRIGEQHI